MAFCENCGHELEEGATFCTNCGMPQKPGMKAPGQNGTMHSDQDINLYSEHSETQGGNPFTGADTGASTGSYTSPEAGFTQDGSSQGGMTSGGEYSMQDSNKPGDGYYADHDNADSQAESFSHGSETVNVTPSPGMGFTEAVRTCLTKYADFSGRARRSEYWYFFLFYFLVTMAANYLGNQFSIAYNGRNLLSIIVLVAFFLPSLAVSVRRLHDIGMSGLFYLLSLLPYIGILVIVAFYIRDSQPGDNKYGPSPKYSRNSPVQY